MIEEISDVRMYREMLKTFPDMSYHDCSKTETLSVSSNTGRYKLICNKGIKFNRVLIVMIAIEIVLMS